MTTYAFSCFSLDYEDNDDHTDDVYTQFHSGSLFSVSAPTGAGFTYTFSSEPDAEEFDVDIDPGSYFSITLGGFDADTIDIESEIVDIEWVEGGIQKTAIVLVLDHEKGDNAEGKFHGTRYFLSLVGDPLPSVTSVAAFEAFDASITSATTATGDYAAGEFIPWASVGSPDVSQVDEVYGTPGDDVVRTGAGDDEIYSSQGDDFYNGGGGWDELHFSGDPSGVDVNFAARRATDGWGDTDVILSIEMARTSMFADTVTGNIENNQVRLLAGDDTFNGGGGTDTVRYDKDAEHGGTAGVTVNLGAGTATDGFGNTDTLSSVENAMGTEQDDSLTGSIADNHLRGLAGDDDLFGENGDDDLDGGDGNDLLDGGRGNDDLDGEDGVDTLLGGNGDDTLNGGSGTDILNGGLDDDILTGGNGGDTFVFEGQFGNDVITDFNARTASEKIDLSGVTSIVGMLDLINNHMTQVGDDVVIQAGSNTITLEGVDLVDLGLPDFIF